LYIDAESKVNTHRFYQNIIRGTKREMGERELTDEHMHEITSLTASSKFIRAFRTRNRFSLRRPLFKRRFKGAKEDMEQFISEPHELPGHSPRDPIVTIEDTNRKAVPGAFVTWAHTDTETV
jgi:hypothetical protein